jgi:type IV pilus assembly protein PilA
MESKQRFRSPNRRAQGFTLVEIMIVVVIIGLLAAMAIPAFQKVRATSQDKAVMNNMRQIGAAADQYYLEFGASTVILSSLVGSPSYIRAISTVANETYPAGLRQENPIIVSGIAGQRTLTFLQ